MLTIIRDQFKTDEVYNKLYQVIKNNHKVSIHTEKTLLEKKDVENFCEEARHYVELPGEKPIYISYDVYSVLGRILFTNLPVVRIRINTINIYDDFLEYNSERIKNLHGSDKSFIPNLN